MTEGALLPEQHQKIFSESIIPRSELLEKSSLDRPHAIILAGQPGSGKGVLSRSAQAALHDDVVVIDPDALRDFHPQVNEFRSAHPYTWSGLTHPDASQWADELLQAAKDSKKNLIFDTTLSNGAWTSELIEDLRSRGYQVEVRAMAAHRLESEHGVDSRFSKSLDELGYARYVPEGAREAIYDKLPGSLDTVHTRTGVQIRIYNRDGVEVYNNQVDARAPGAALQEARAARLEDPAVTKALNADWKTQVTWHRDLPQTPHNPKVSTATATEALTERGALHVQEGVQRGAAAVHTQDFNIRVKPEVMGGLRIAGTPQSEWRKRL